MAKSKRQIAEEFVSAITAMTSQEISALIASETDQELVKFFEKYGSDAMLLNLHRPLKVAAVLILTGYLIRAREEQSTVIIMPKGNA